MTAIVSAPAVEPDFDRDRWGRPKITLPDGSTSASYQRCTRYVGVLEDMFNLQQWEKRMVALGLADRPDLMLSIQAHRDDKGALNRICNEAKEAAKGSAAATTGTALHALTDMLDRGQKLPHLPPGAAASLDAFKAATAPLKVVGIESKLVLDTHKVAGTADRIYELDGKRYIGDTKSGNIELGILKIAMQLAVYARSYAYNVTTGERSVHGCETTRAIIMHLPATDDPAEARCEMHWVDIEAGWQAVLVARDVWANRKLKFKDLAQPFDGTVPESSIRRDRLEAQRTEKSAQARRELLEARILACANPEDVRQLWANHEAEWDEHLTEVARAHVNKLPAA